MPLSIMAISEWNRDNSLIIRGLVYTICLYDTRRIKLLDVTICSWLGGLTTTIVAWYATCAGQLNPKEDKGCYLTI